VIHVQIGLIDFQTIPLSHRNKLE